MQYDSAFCNWHLHLHYFDAKVKVKKCCKSSSLSGDYMKRQKDLRNPKSTEDLWLVLQDVWNNLPAEFLQKLCASVSGRIDAILKAKGVHTKY